MTELEALKTETLSMVFRGLLPLSKKYQQNFGGEDRQLVAGLYSAIEGAISNVLLNMVDISKEDKEKTKNTLMDALLSPIMLNSKQIEMLKDAGYIKKIEFYEGL